MRSLASEQRPRAANSRAVIGTAIVVFTVAIAIVPPPSRSVGQIDAQHVIDDLHRINDARIVRRTQSKPHQRQRISADQFIRGNMTRFAETVADFDDPSQLRPRFTRYVGRDAHIVSGNSRLPVRGGCP